MPSIDDLVKEYGKEIEHETVQYRGVLQNQVSRDPVRRPWDGLEEPLEAQSGNLRRSGGGKSADSEMENRLWYASWRTMLASIRLNIRLILFVFFFFLAIFCGILQTVPSTYSSALHLYAPEKTDSISNRLALFSNRLEFASFPVDFKIPLGLVARRLKSFAAREWVLNKYESQPHNNVSAEIDARIVRAETFYAEGSELLVIQGYANEPLIAAQVTNLYWDYLENEIRKMREENITKVNQWVDLTVKTLDQRLHDTSVQIQKSTATPIADSRARINSKLSEAYSDLEMRKLQLQKELEELRTATGSNHDVAKLWMVSNSEIQDLRQVDQALSHEQGNLSAAQITSKRADIETQARRLAQKLLDDKEIEFSNLKVQAFKIKPRVDANELTDRDRQSSERLRDLFRHQTDYQNQLEELERLKAQLKVEQNLTTTRLRPIQAALPDSASRRPILILKYLVGILLSFLLAIGSLIWVESRKAKSREVSRQPGMGVPLGQPHSPGAGA